MGSVGIAAWIARVVFVGLVVWGLVYGGTGRRTLTVFVVLGLAALFGLPYLHLGAFVTPVLALIAIALVLVVFKGDVRIT